MIDWSLIDKRCLNSFPFPIQWILRLYFWTDTSHIVRLVRIVFLQFPNLWVSHDIDNFQLSDQVIDEEFNGLYSKKILYLFNICVLVNKLHQVFDLLFVVDTVDAGLWKTYRQLLQYVVTCFHYLGARERFNLQEGVTWIYVKVPELSLIFYIGT